MYIKLELQEEENIFYFQTLCYSVITFRVHHSIKGNNDNEITLGFVLISQVHNDTYGVCGEYLI